MINFLRKKIFLLKKIKNNFCIKKYKKEQLEILKSDKHLEQRIKNMNNLIGFKFEEAEKASIKIASSKRFANLIKE